MGFLLSSLGLLVLFVTIKIFGLVRTLIICHFISIMLILAELLRSPMSCYVLCGICTCIASSP